MSIVQMMLGVPPDADPEFDRERVRPPERLLDFDGQQELLSQMLIGYRAQFRVGDWVTPVQNSGLAGWGRPYVVAEALEDPGYGTRPPRAADPDDESSTSFGRRWAYRVACVRHEQNRPQLLFFWAEAWQLERWTEEVGRARLAHEVRAEAEFRAELARAKQTGGARPAAN